MVSCIFPLLWTLIRVLIKTKSQGNKLCVHIITWTKWSILMKVAGMFLWGRRHEIFLKFCWPLFYFWGYLIIFKVGLYSISWILTLRAPRKIIEQTTIYFCFLFFRENNVWHYMWIVCQADDSHVMSSIISS